MTTERNPTAIATEVSEEVTRPALLNHAQTQTRNLAGNVTSIDNARFYLLTQESERVSRAATVLVAAQLLSNGTSAREIARMRGINASSFSRDRLWSQLAPLSATLTAAREAGQLSLATVEIEVPASRSEMRTYTFHDVSTTL